MFHKLIEVTLGQLSNKQKSVTRLFPDFFSNPKKVPGVISKGGVRLSSIEKDKWTFKVHSGTEEGLWYDVVVRWKDVEKDVQKLVSDRRNWTKNKKKADLKKIAAKLFKDGNVELSCDCDAQQYWGPAYQLTQKHAKYGDQEDRSPDVRNPKQYGQYCKHVQVLMRTLPFYKSTIANWLGKEFKDLIQRAEGTATQTAQQYKAAGQALGKHTARESIQEAVATLPEPQQVMLDELGSATEEDMRTTSTYPGEEDCVKFWLLSDGTLIHVPCAHSSVLQQLDRDTDDPLSSGAARIRVHPNVDLQVEAADPLNDEQIHVLKDLMIRYKTKAVAADSDTRSLHKDTPTPEPEHLEHILKFGSEGMDEKKIDLTKLYEQGEEAFKNAIAMVVRRFKLWTKVLDEDAYWLLPDGNAIAVTNHMDAAKVGGVSVSRMEKYGCFRVQVDGSSKRLLIYGARPLSTQQSAWLRKLIVANELETVEAENTGANDWDEFGPDTPDGLISGIVKLYQVGDARDVE